jgi:hypothetical protein
MKQKERPAMLFDAVLSKSNLGIEFAFGFQVDPSTENEVSVTESAGNYMGEDRLL